jgi:hypothetical protein
MDRVEYIPMAEAARLKGVRVKTASRRFERRGIAVMTDPEDARRRLVPVTALSPNEYEQWVKDRTRAALRGIGGEQKPDESITVATRQPVLPFASPSQKERVLLDAVPPIPERYRPYIEIWSAIVGDDTNGTWKRYRGQSFGGVTIQDRGDFIRAQAKVHGVGVSTIREKLAVLKDVNHDPAIPPERRMEEFWKRILPKNRPGRSGRSFFSDDENAWMREKLLSFYLTQAKLSAKHAHRLLLDEIEAKQRIWGPGHLYQKPTLHQCRTVLKSIKLPTSTLALHQAAPPGEIGRFLCD